MVLKQRNIFSIELILPGNNKKHRIKILFFVVEIADHLVGSKPFLPA